MATAVLSHNNSYTEDDDKHLELFSLIWFDANSNVEKSRNAEQKLRSIINHLIKFQDAQQCQQYIEHRSKEDRLVLVVSGQLAQEIVLSVHKLRQVLAIYVHFEHGESNEQWVHTFPKVSCNDNLSFGYFLSD
jgi:hypothetical protein